MRISSSTSPKNATLPNGLTSESAFYACDGPKNQVLADLRLIVSQLDGWDTPEADLLRAEAEELLLAEMA